MLPVRYVLMSLACAFSLLSPVRAATVAGIPLPSGTPPQVRARLAAALQPRLRAPLVLTDGQIGRAHV